MVPTHSLSTTAATGQPSTCSLLNPDFYTIRAVLHCDPTLCSALTCSHTSAPSHPPACFPPRGLSALCRCKYGDISHRGMCHKSLTKHTAPIIRGYGCNLRSAKLLFEVTPPKVLGSEQGEGECCANLPWRSSQKTSGIFALAGCLRRLI